MEQEEEGRNNKCSAGTSVRDCRVVACFFPFCPRRDLTWQLPDRYFFPAGSSRNMHIFRIASYHEALSVDAVVMKAFTEGSGVGNRRWKLDICLYNLLDDDWAGEEWYPKKL